MDKTSGPYGKGTFEGFGIIEWKYDFTQTPLIHQTTANYTLMQAQERLKVQDELGRESRSVAKQLGG